VPLAVGSGDFQYEIVPDWGRLPYDVTLYDVAAVAVDGKDRVFVFNRGEHPMLVLNSAGQLLRSWGEGVFTRPHGVHIGPDGAVYCTDDGDHTVRKFSAEGKILLELGIPGQPAPLMSGKPFHRCTHTALSPSGDIYVSDGYGNACIHRFTPDGRLLQTWGESGCGPGQFYIPHNLCCDDEGWIYVADRENHRIQVFDGQGRFETQWNGLHRPCALCSCGQTPAEFYVGEAGPAMRATLQFPNLGPRISILNRHGVILGRLGDLPAGIAPGRFVAPHGIAVDSAGDIYLAEVSFTGWPAVFPGEPCPRNLPTLHKLRRKRVTDAREDDRT
jgi:DNA-binding beta-propeller fold protein YncE